MINLWFSLGGDISEVQQLVGIYVEPLVWMTTDGRR